MYWTTYDSPIGRLFLSSDGHALTGLWISGQKFFQATFDPLSAEQRSNIPVFEQTISWLNAYFSAASLPDLPPLTPKGSLFQQAVWNLLQMIPYGETTTYGALSRTLQSRGISASPQAVGGAVGHNPISILIPCHRVLGVNGRLTGYAGGLAAKEFLLRLEGTGGISFKK